MRVIVSAGGTGGHIYPALAVIDKIKEQEPDSEILYIGTHNRMENDIIPSKGIPFVPVKMFGINKKKPFTIFKTGFYFIKSMFKLKKVITEFNPDLVIGFGGYITGPVIYTSKKLGYKTFIHEQNAKPGKSNKFLERYADVIGVSTKSTINLFNNKNTIHTGNPTSERAYNAKPEVKKYFDNNNKQVLYVMGSLGSSEMNEIFINSLDKLKTKSYNIIFVTGKKYYDELKNKEYPNNIIVKPILENMTNLMKSSDLIVSRAGASTLAEIEATNIPSILIPSPYVANNEQYYNAIDLEKDNSAIVIQQKDFNSETLVETMDKILSDEETIKRMKENLSKHAITNSATKIYEILKGM